MSLRHNRGFNLVELMVAMVAGLLLVAAASALFASILKANKTAMQVSRLNQELQSITDMMARDIQRAGYDASAAEHTLDSGVSGTPSLFYFDSTQHLLNKYSSSPDKFRCIAVKYDERDANATPSPGTAEDNEVVVYSYHPATLGGSVWMAELTASAAEQTSAALQTLVDACSDEDVADPISTNGTIKITDLTFTLLPSSVSSGARTIRLTISGNDIKSPALGLTLQRDIKLRNDGF
ncbi:MULTISPECIES: prepilin-type N-terminal cleavage/methylation domain-containing protein [Aeromonas]|uniref:prepilin-type N-terminal cleavage/methylation domain-containing protein n=1 Tax=Aeromonas caviae TaxID=648 RepID=UPI001F222B07|nr:prepilin-type N-terminal cleavage/methylation domain-containing protein [Aeromonas caviae]